MHNLNRHYYALNIDSRKSALEQSMLLSLHKHSWTRGLVLHDWEQHTVDNARALERMLGHVKEYQRRLDEEDGKTPLEIIVSSAGKLDPKKHLEEAVEGLFASNIDQALGSMLDTVVF
jgi:26S proteasome regulatory subunit N11